MWQGFTIALREGIESFLIVALTLAVLKRTGRGALARAVAAGIGVSVLVCAGAAWLLQRAANKSLWEGILAGTSAVLVGSFLVYMLRSAKTLRSDMERRVVRAAKAGSFGGVFLFTVLMMTREGMEVVLLGVTTLFQMRSAAAPFVLGLSLGIVAAAAVAFTWTRLGRNVNLSILLTISAVFLGLFLVQLCLYTVHELSEANVLPNSQAINDATEILGPDGRIGHALAYALALVPTIWLVLAWWRSESVRRGARPVHP